MILDDRQVGGQAHRESYILWSFQTPPREDEPLITALTVSRWADYFEAYSARDDEVKSGPIPQDPDARSALIRDLIVWLRQAQDQFEPVYFVLRAGQCVILQRGEERATALKLTPQQFRELSGFAQIFDSRR